MTWIGDIRLGDTVDHKFTTRQISGAPFTLAGSPVVSNYVGNSTTQITAGITLTVDFDGVTGLNNVRVVATSGNGYATATNNQLVITTGTVNSVSVVGEVIGSYSIEARSALMPTTAARTLDVTATGEAGIDWANIGSPTTAVNLSATNIDTDQVVASVTGAVGSVTGAVGSVTGNVGGSVGSVTGNVGGNVAGSVGSVTARVTANTDQLAGQTVTAAAGVTFPTSVASPTNITAGTITTVTNLTNAPTNGDLTAAMKASVNAEVLDVLNVDTFAEPGQEAPPATTTLVKKIGYLYKLLRNKITQTSTTLSVYDDAGTTVDQKATVSDDGVTYTRGEIGSGP